MVAGSPIRRTCRPNWNRRGTVVLDAGLSSRGAQGWSTHDIGTLTTRRRALRIRNISSSRRSVAGLSFLKEVMRHCCLSSQASEPTPYIRHQSLCDAASTASECYLPCYRQRKGMRMCRPALNSAANRILVERQFEGASPDLSHVVLNSSVR